MKHIRYFDPAEQPGVISVAKKPQMDEVWEIFRAVREAREHFSLSPGALSTLQAMISVMKESPIVFLGNRELSIRSNGYDERTIRRHIGCLVDAGLAERRDSSNRKRYRLNDPLTGSKLVFGIDLSPLFQRAAEIREAAKAVFEERARVKFLKAKIRALIAWLDAHDVTIPQAEDLRKSLRRKLSSEALQAMIDAAPCPIPDTATATAGFHESKGTAFNDEDPAKTERMSVRNSQNVRHYQRSYKEDIYDKTAEEHRKTQDKIHADVGMTGISLQQLIEACPEPCLYSSDTLKSWRDVVCHAEILAPMIGISKAIYEKAKEHRGPVDCAKTLFALIQMGQRIKSPSAYFHSITIGIRSTRFSADHLILSLSKNVQRNMV